MSLWKAYTSLSSRTRLFLGFGLIAWSGIGLYLSDWAEKRFGLEASEHDRKKLREALPRVEVVEGEKR